ncbi:MAG TPA: amino acid adenylation domain-containing protein, partial [Thermoanaerobaculia bacterium]|nr:amino acid adenylation domain-containing protein [Thermoanaerobaculia bacterium]
RRHETLRTTFGESQGKPVQSIAPPPSLWELPLADLTALPVAARLPEARRLAEEEAGRPFDLERGPVLRTTLLRLGAAHHALLLDIHHIASDGWSMGVMTREIAPLYAAAADRRPSPLPQLAVQYADFAVWQRRWLSGDVLERQLAYWRDKLAGLPVLELPTDWPRPAEPTFRGVTFSHPLGAALTREARSRARQQDATLFMVLLAAFQALLERYTGQPDFAVGAPIANRNRAEVEPLIGFFVNSLVLRGDLTGDPPFSGLVERTRKTALEAFSYQDLPFERLVEELRPERRLTHNPLFQVAFAVQNAPVDRIDLQGLSLAPLESSSPSSRFDLEVTFWEVEEELLAQITYSTDLLDEPTVRRLVGHLQSLLLGVVENPARHLSRLPVFQEEEAHQILREWNDTERPLPVATVVDLFREQAARRPGAIALSSAEGDLSYADLDARSDRLARRLAGAGVRADEPVGILAERSHALVVGMLGILKAGGAYLPLDSNYPAERLAWMLADSGARVLLGQPEKLAALSETVRPQVMVELTADPALPALPADTRGPASGGILPGNLAYVMYTSGSTGRPKAVGITHGNVVRLVREGGYARLGPDEVHLQFAPISFDASAFEIWAPLANGGRLVMAPPGRLSLDEIGRTVESQGVTVLLLTTGLFNQMVDHRLDLLRGVRQFLTGGEALSPVHGERALRGLPGVTLINVYGPTEVTVFISTHSMNRPEEVGTPVSIGRPVGNTWAVVVDRELRPVPLGVIGELCAGGSGVARGYVGRPDLTAERFVPDPVGGFGERLYRTGDLARLRADGLLEFLGRRDGQVKLRGFRVELGEIEAALARHPEVHEAAVTIREDWPGDRRLVAYVVPRSPGGEAPVGLREALAAILPEHMIPSAFVALPALPLTSNGKVDRAALLASAAPEGQAAPPVAYAPPETPLEVRIAALYAEVLGLERVGRHDGFFDLGGHSLLATQVMSRLRDSLGVDLPLRRMFESSSVAGLARVV